MRVSVVMPVRDGERFLVEAVESVLEQKLTELELIVVDDGSTDGTPGLLAGLARRDARIRVPPSLLWSPDSRVSHDSATRREHEATN